MEPELPGQEKIMQNREQGVGIHIVSRDAIILELNGMISIYQTGRFPIVSQRGNKYIMVLHNYDSNTILATPTTTRNILDLFKAYSTVYEQLI